MKIELKPIAYVKNSRTEIEDDNWEQIISEIKLADHILYIIFYMDKVLDEKAKAQSRHPRNNKELPQLGTYAQRNKNRPNKLGLTTVELIERKDRIIKVKYLDAINCTPILDIKPVMKEFQPRTEINQPDWTKEIMKNYWTI